MIFNRKPKFAFLILLISVCMLQSCFTRNKILFVFNQTSVKNPPKDSTPFVFGNEVHIEPGVVSKDEKNRLESELDNYWDDTIKARTVQQFGLFYRIKNPQRYDTIGISRSMVFMNSYLQSQGYYNAVLTPERRIDSFRYGTPKQQFRVTSIMQINPGKRLRFDSIAHNLVDSFHAPTDSVLHQLALEVNDKVLLRKGDPYSKQIIASELDRLVAWFRQNGYYRLGRENLAALVDTTDQLIDSLVIDPFELARRTAEAAERRRQNPTADVTILQATMAKDIPFDTAAITRYRVGKIYYYPETNATTDIPDSLLQNAQFNVRPNRSGTIFMKHPGANPRFRMRPLLRNTYITRGEYYNERLFYRTVNSLGQIGTWSQVDVRDSIKNDTIDFHIFLSPNKKKNIRFDSELTRSTGDFASSNNLFGIGGNVTYLNRNFLRLALQAVSSVRGGVELNLQRQGQLLQTVQLSVGQSIAIPYATWPFRKNEKKNDAARTVINLNAGYTERYDFFRVRSLVGNIGWEFRRGNQGLSFRLPNIELYSLDTLPLLQVAFDSNPFLRTAFNTGSVLSGIVTWNMTIGSKRNPYFSQYIRGGFEYAGLGLPYLFPSLEDNLYHYAKVEGETILKWQRSKTAFVVRGLFGIGYNLINDPKLGRSLPFFKQFVAGGPNSMRGWAMRQLGLGSSLKSELAPDFKDRFGDVQLEANVEQRFQVANFGGAILSSAVFLDMGNIWNLKYDPQNPGAEFRFGKLPKDIAMALGVGLLRLNVSNFIIRVDFGIKLKDPTRQENGGWMDFGKFSWKNKYGNNNYAFQLGIGLPF